MRTSIIIAATSAATLVAAYTSAAALSHAEITDMTVSRGGHDTAFEQSVWMIDSIGQHVSGLAFASSATARAELADGYRFPVQPPSITNIACLRGSHAVSFDWIHDVDMVYAGATNVFLPGGADYAADAIETDLPAALTTFQDTLHSNASLRIYRVSFEDEFATEIIGKITRLLVPGWNICSLPFIPITNSLSFLVNDQLKDGSIMRAPFASAVYTPSAHTNIVVPHFFIGGDPAHEWRSIEPPVIPLKRAFYIRIPRAAPANYITFAGFVPQEPVDMSDLPPGWTLFAQPFPVSVALDNTDLWAAGLEPGTLTTNGHSGDAVFSQLDGFNNILAGAFLQSVPGQLFPAWTGPMQPFLQPGRGYWAFVRSEHPGVNNWLYGLPYFITPIEY